MGSSSESRTSIRHLQALDGLRGLALLGVLFFHAGGALRGGYLGVDLFFVLSGYLITSLLLGEHRATGRVALWPFWVRRARRLFPALLSLMPAIALYARFFAKPAELQGIRADALATIAYVANWRAIFSHKSYWQLFAAPSPLEHTWSLAIEEQFYVVWPLVVAFVLRRRTRRTLLLLTLMLIVMSMVAMIVLFDPEKTSRVYLGTDTRAASILAGAALAALVAPDTTFQPSTVRKLDALGALSALGLAFAWFSLEGSSRFLYRGGFWLAELAVLVLILCAISGSRSLVARALSIRPLTFLGTVSYGVYLWHWPVNVFLTPERVQARGFWLHVIQFAVTFAISLVSYRWVEQPIRRKGLPFGRAFYVVPSAVALAVVLVVRGTYARELPAQPVLANMFEPIGESGRDVFRVMLLGDSTANSLGWGLRAVRQPGLVVDLVGQDGCTMLADMCGGPQWTQRTKELHPNATILFLGGAFLHGTSVDGEWRKSCHPVWDGKFETNLVRRLGDLVSPGGRVWVSTIPYPIGEYDTATFRAEVDCINASIRKAAAAVRGIETLEFAEQLCPRGECLREYDGKVIRPDGVHYTIDGAAKVSRWVLAEIQR
ncbi:MAG TPA: acyltransferase family protein [Labilithrix sp.]|nr:acyltransferase family protein [Labilithrix sp.]